MKNKKLKVTLIILLIIILIIGSLFIIYIVIPPTTGGSFKAAIMENGKSISGKPLVLVEEISYMDGKATFNGARYDLLITEKTSITYKGKKIDVSELKKGDLISVTYKDESTFASNPTPLNDITKIKLLEKSK